MKITILGSCSGTEPMVGRRHTSTVLTSNEHMYLIDAGDGCAYTAHMLGYDMTRLEAVFISHPHIDHVGGLPFLFFLIDKMCWRMNKVYDRVLNVYTPSAKPVVGALMMDNEAMEKSVIIRAVSDGVIFDDGNLKVEARHNGHLDETKEPFHSYSFLLSLEEKKIVYSGDIKSINELDGWLDCDLLMMETGHHDPMDVARYLSNKEEKPKKLVFMHHGRTMLADPEGCKQKCRDIFGENTDVAYDGMTLEM